MEIQNFIFNNENYCQMNQEVKTCCQGVQMAFTGMKSVSLLIKYFPFFLLNWYRNCQGCILKPLCNIFFQIEKGSLVPPCQILYEAKTQKKTPNSPFKKTYVPWWYIFRQVNALNDYHKKMRSSVQKFVLPINFDNKLKILGNIICYLFFAKF